MAAVGGGETSLIEGAAGISFNAEGTLMPASSLLIRWRFSYSWMDTNHLSDLDLSVGYIFFFTEVRIGLWLMDTDGADSLWGPYFGIAFWF